MKYRPRLWPRYSVYRCALLLASLALGFLVDGLLFGGSGDWPGFVIFGLAGAAFDTWWGDRPRRRR